MDQIGNYKIIEKIGEGGMGEVYKGLDTMLEREVAIKLMRPELINRQEIVDRFKSEAIATGRLNHSSITTLYNFGQTENQYYMALEFVNGETLDSILKKRGALPWREALNYAIAALEGLEYAHQLKIIHRDIKPSNIMINEQDNVKIMDFGIARILEKARLTKTGNFIGTLEYTPPEQIQGKEGDARSDIYSLGAVLYEMLTGNALFKGDTEFELMNSQIKEKPKPLREFKQEIPSKLEKAVLQALEKNPAKRFTSALAFSEDLRKLALTEAAGKKQTGENGFMAFLKNYPAVVVAIVLLVPAGGYALWNLSSGVSDPTLEPVMLPPQPQTAEFSFPDMPSENLPPVVDNPTIASVDPQPLPPIERIPQLTLVPENEYIQSMPDGEPILDIDDFDFATLKTGKTPIPIEKPESEERQQLIHSITQTKRVAPVQSATTRQPGPASNNSASSPEEIEDIGEWATDFFSEN